MQLRHSRDCTRQHLNLACVQRTAVAASNEAKLASDTKGCSYDRGPPSRETESSQRTIHLPMVVVKHS